MKRGQLKANPEKIRAWKRRSKPLTASKVIIPRSAPKKRATGKKTTKKKPSARLLKQKLWAECKRITRDRHGNTCYTCGRTPLEGSNWQTGHFIASSVCSVEMRYSLNNLRPQCYNCNINKSGNWPAFEEHLKRDGFDVEALKQRNRDTVGEQYDSLWYLAKIEEYKNIL